MKDFDADKGNSKVIISILVQTVIGLILSGLVILLYPWPKNPSDQLKTVADAFSIIAILYLCFGSLLLVSSTGFFDIFGFAIRRGAHALLPGLVNDNLGDYYEYQEEKKLKRKSYSLKSTFIAGVILFAVALALTIWWVAAFDK